MKSKSDDFLASLDAPIAPPEFNPLLKAVWHGLRGEWDSAHNIAQDDDGVDAAWVHAWLHREEGDLPNASYWYRRAKRPPAEALSFKDEGITIAEYFLSRQ